MDQTKAIMAIVTGCAALVFAFIPSQWYYSNDLIGISQSSRKAPTWLARLISFIVAAGFIAAGVSYFFTGR